MGGREEIAATVERYHEACSRGDAETIAACCTPGVVHYFTDPATPPVTGAEHLGRYWRKVRRLRRARWRLERILVGEDEAAIEWTMVADGPGGDRLAVRGAEWYRFEGGLISEVRAYFDPAPGGGLNGFPYRERGYAMADEELGAETDEAPGPGPGG